MLDGALEVLDDDLVAAPVGPVDQQQDAGEQVLQDVLEGEADRDRADAQRAEHVDRLHGGKDDRGRDEQREEQHDAIGDRAQHVAEIGFILYSTIHFMFRRSNGKAC